MAYFNLQGMHMFWLTWRKTVLVWIWLWPQLSILLFTQIMDLSLLHLHFFTVTITLYHPFWLTNSRTSQIYVSQSRIIQQNSFYDFTDFRGETTASTSKANLFPSFCFPPSLLNPCRTAKESVEINWNRLFGQNPVTLSVYSFFRCLCTV